MSVRAYFKLFFNWARKASELINCKPKIRPRHSGRESNPGPRLLPLLEDLILDKFVVLDGQDEDQGEGESGNGDAANGLGQFFLPGRHVERPEDEAEGGQVVAVAHRRVQSRLEKEMQVLLLNRADHQTIGSLALVGGPSAKY